MSIFDSIGTVFEGGLFARAVEPRAGARASRGDHAEDWHGKCLNCGTERVGPYCHACGQDAHVHRSMHAFLHDLLHGALHFEGKTWHTVPLLAWRPGQLTRRYIDGERARFVSPMALFLFSVFLMFAVFQIAGITPPTELGAPIQMDQAANPEEARQQLDNLEKARAEMGEDNPVAPLVDGRIASLEKQLGEETTGAAAATASSSAGNDVLPGLTDGAGESKAKATGEYTGIAFVDHGVDKWRKNPGLMAYKLQSNSYKFSWLLIPLSLPFVWLLFAWKRRFGIYDHAVFVTYSLSFMTLLYVALVLLGAVGVTTEVLMILGTTIPLLHIYKQMKGAYCLSRFSAVWRTIMLTVFIFVILVLFLNVLLVLGAMG